MFVHLLFIIQNTIHQRIIKCIIENSVSLLLWVSNANENEFHGFGNLVIWLWKSFGKVLELILKEFVQALLIFCGSTIHNDYLLYIYMGMLASSKFYSQDLDRQGRPFELFCYINDNSNEQIGIVVLVWYTKSEEFILFPFFRCDFRSYIFSIIYAISFILFSICKYA